MLPEILTEIPGPRSRASMALLRRYESQNVTYSDAEYPIFWQRAEGNNVWDVDGNRYLDWTSAFGVTGLGHSHPAVCEAMRQQSGELIHAMGDVHPTPLKATLCAKLSELTFERWGAGTAKTILGNSGFEAVEAALKTALLATGRSGVIAFHGAYHGLGYGALEVAGTGYFKAPFRSQLSEFGVFHHFPSCRDCRDKGAPISAHEEGTRDFPECGGRCIEALRQAIEASLSEQQIGAILVEPIQGRGGENLPPLAFLQMLREICTRHGVLLILDEIYTGFNRTGALFACEHSGVVPDLLCVGKALTSGYPLSACIGRAALMDAAWPLTHGEALHTSTFLGNPVGCAMALASLSEHEKPSMAALVMERGRALKEALRGLRSPAIREVRGAGLLVGLELALTGEQVNQIVKRGLRDGLILLQSGPEGNVLGFTPPFAIRDEEIAFTVGRLQEYLTFLPGSLS